MRRHLIHPPDQEPGRIVWLRRFPLLWQGPRAWLLRCYGGRGAGLRRLLRALWEVSSHDDLAIVLTALALVGDREAQGELEQLRRKTGADFHAELDEMRQRDLAPNLRVLAVQMALDAGDPWSLLAEDEAKAAAAALRRLADEVAARRARGGP